MKKISLIVIAIIVLLVVGGGAFYIGMSYGKSQSPYATRASRALRSAGPGASQSGFTSGTILSKDSQSITISLPSSGSKIIFYSDATQISKTVSGTTNDLSAGTLVGVTGTNNSDGSETARLIQIMPAGQNRPTSTSPGFPPTQTPQ